MSSASAGQGASGAFTAAYTRVLHSPLSHLGAQPFPIGPTAMLELVKRHMGRAGVTPHGFRATFSTWVTEQTDTPTEIRELALAHVSGDKVAAA